MTRRTLLALLSVLLIPELSHAQLAPNADWRTLTTPHFYVHFTPPVEGLARRIAVDAESAYVQLSAELHPPRGMIDVVLSDDADFSNGSATPYPSNRIVIYANPPVSESALRYTNDWGRTVITHELTHIFHLDRSRGLWSLGQHVFGRAAALFPNLYSPGWLTEGLAVYEESHLAGAGRVEGSEHRMIARAAAIDHRFPPLGALSLGQARFPFGETAYSFGSLFVDYLARTRGDAGVRSYVEHAALFPIPFLLDVPAKQGFGITFSRAYRDFRDSIAHATADASIVPADRWRQLTNDGVYVFAPRWLSDSAIVYSGAPGRETFGAYRVDLRGDRHRIGRRNGQSANVPLPGGGLLYSQLEYVNPYQLRSDLWVQRGGHERRLTFDQRLANPDVRGDGEIVATQIVAGTTRLVRVSRDGKRIMPITAGSYDEQWTEPRWSHSGRYVVASRWLRGNVSQIVVVDTVGRVVHLVSSGTSIEATPSWLAGDIGILYSSDRTGSAQVYLERFDRPGAFDASHTVQLSGSGAGLFEPTAAPSADRLAAVSFRADGYHLGVIDACCTVSSAGGRLSGARSVTPYRDTVPHSVLPAALGDTSTAVRYSAWRSLLPRYWLPTLDPGLDNGYRLGGLTSGFDVVGRHTMTLRVEVPLNDRGGVVGDASYTYAGLGVPVIRVDASQDWASLQGVYDRTPSTPVVGEVFRRTRNADFLLTWLRQRYRTTMSLSGGAGVEYRTHVSVPDGLLPRIDTTGAFGSLTFPNLVASASFSNSQRPPFAISPEDGVQLGLTVRDRLRSGAAGTGSQSFSTIGLASAFKSLDFPGFAHHVIALRASAGYSDERASGYYSIGGVSGGSFDIIPGYSLGEGRSTFPVRGFQPGTLIGTRAVTASAEYRLPLFLPGVAPAALPFFFDRSSIALFGDFGTAWCPDVRPGREVCNRATLDQRIDIGSAGAELNVNLGVLSWDAPYQFRIGVAHPLQNGAYFGEGLWQSYFVIGGSF